MSALPYYQILPQAFNTRNGGLPFLLPAFALLTSSDSSDPLTLGTCFEQGSRKVHKVSVASPCSGVPSCWQSCG